MDLCGNRHLQNDLINIFCEISFWLGFGVWGLGLLLYKAVDAGEALGLGIRVQSLGGRFTANPLLPASATGVPRS